MRCTIHQPEHLPWLGFWQKLAVAETLVILDQVQFKKRHFECRNKIGQGGQAQWITVPTVKCPRSTLIDTVRIDLAAPWREKNLESVRRAYRRAPHFKEMFADFSHIYGGEYVHLIDLNLELIGWIVERCGFGVQVVTQSSLGTQEAGSRLIEEVCVKVGAGAYVSGLSGAEYLDLPAFEERGIQIEFVEYRGYYSSVKSENLCILDYLFQFGYSALVPYLRG